MLHNKTEKLLDDCTSKLMKLRNLLPQFRGKLPQELEWLADNSYMLSAENQTVKEYLQNHRHDDLSRVLSLCREYVHEKQDFSSEGILSFFQDKELSESELDALPFILKFMVIEAISEYEKPLFSAFTEHRSDPETSEEIGRLFTALRKLSILNFGSISEKLSIVEKILSEDPAGAYRHMNEASRAAYRREISRLAKKYKISEKTAAMKAVELSRKSTALRSRHVGYYIIEKPLGKKCRNFTAVLYVLSLVLFPLFSFFLPSEGILPAVIIWFIAFDIVKQLADRTILSFVPRKVIPSMDPDEPIPEDASTVCVITALLSSEKNITACAERLEDRYLASGDEKLCFALLGDLPAADTPTCESDAGLLIQAENAVAELNRKYGRHFILLTRGRTFSKSEGKYIPFERKRGALMAFAALCLGEKSELSVLTGALPENLRYCVVLDEDTVPLPGALRSLIAAMRHPLNQPVFKNGIVSEGHAILQPRISYFPHNTRFSSVLAGSGGTDIYGASSPELYDTLCRRTNFCGKGIIDLRAYYSVMKERLPSERILSHDLIEGCFLHSGYAPNSEFMENFPADIRSYLRREHRWIRGDWQILPWLFSSVPTSDGHCRNPLDFWDRWRIFDNLRRSISYPVLYAGLFFLTRGRLLPAAAVILCVFLPFLLSDSSQKEVYAGIPSPAKSSFLNCFTRFMLLPVFAWLNVSAAVTALFRMLISRRRLLEWTTFAQSESSAGKFILSLWPELTSAVLITLPIFGRDFMIFRAALAVLWVFTPWYISALCRPNKSRNFTSSDDDRRWITAQAAEMYAYFRDNMNEENSFLPPDNIQVRPDAGTAHRTSPTNIGLGLVSLLAAVDMGIADLGEVFTLIEKTLSTLERMEKWHGQLLNWYDTRNALPLYPRTVSAVDSGNLLACLTVLKAGLLEYDAAELAERIGVLIEKTDLSPLYDNERHLFRLGWNVERDVPFEGWYDMLESEARLTSFIASAHDAVFPRHWQALGRQLAAKNSRRGLVSWSGTMFEYLMPSLFMAEYPGTLLHESSRYAVYCQRMRTGIPFGISESCFFAFDSDMNYRYKAHGVQAAGLKRGLDRELVLSPYSSWLALTVDPENALKSLKKFEKMNMHGRYGFYESADFTRSRLPADCDFMPVRCFMAHHLGMSITAAANVICDNIMVRRFMSQPKCRAFRTLLMERIPVGTPIAPRMPADIPERRERFEKGERVFHSAEDYSFTDPHFTCMSNGSFRVLLTDSGHIRVMSGMRDLSRFDGEKSGINFFFMENGELHGLTPAPLYENAVYSSRFDPVSAEISAKTDIFSSCLQVLVSPDDMSCLFAVTVSNPNEQPLRGELIFSFEPVLDRQENLSAHPAFSKLFLSSEERDGGILVSRRKRGDSLEWYSFAACDHDFCSEISRETAFLRQGYFGLTEYRSGNISVPDPIAVLRVKLDIPAGQSESVRFSLSCGNSPESSHQAAVSALSLTAGTAAHRLREIIDLLQLEPIEVKHAFDLYSDAVFITSSRKHQDVLPDKARNRELLWRFGISGDLPLVYAEFDENKTHEAEQLIRYHMLLHLSSAYCDLVLITDDGGDYYRKQYGSLMQILRSWDGESLVGMKGGVHIIDRTVLNIDELLSVKLLCGSHYCYSRTSEMIHPLPLQKPLKAGTAVPKWGKNCISFSGSPSRIWSHPLANKRFGWIAADHGCGNMWYLNSRENRINPWYNDPIADRGPESFIFQTAEGNVDLFSEKLTFTPGLAVWTHESPGIKLTTFVCAEASARIFIVEADSSLPSARLIWHTRLQLGENFRDRAQVVTHVDPDGGIIYAENKANPRFAPYFFAAGSLPQPARFTCDEHDFMQGKMSSVCGSGYEPCMAMEIPFELVGDIYRAVLVCGCIENKENLGFITELCDSADHELEKVENLYKNLTCDLEINTPEPRLDRFINVFALNQVITGRLLARSSVYQSSGAFGFRDQLQDVLALLSAPPSQERYALVRRQILRAAARQYEEGDVQHWWHEDKISTRGVRTRVTDDLLFLPYVALEYVRVTHDRSIMDEKVPYLCDKPLRDGENERLNSPPHTKYSETLWEHCRRAMDCVIRRGTGSHGLALLGGGDWNDAMNEAGIKGHGESVWLTWFAAMVAEKMGKYVEADCRRYLDFSQKLLNAAYKAWDGEWFLRGWHDNGTPIGSKGNTACRIDAISQAFSIAADGDTADKSRRNMQLTALKNAYKLLPKDGVIRLFDPPFDSSTANHGYISAYPPGIRENGGQYTHGAVWLGIALLRAGLKNEGYDILSSLLPSERGDEYKAEPYYLAADVYSGRGIHGMAGWTIYTGAAGWYYTAAVRELLGLHFSAKKLEINPRIPDNWPGFEAVLHTDSAELLIKVHRGNKNRIVLDGIECESVPLPLPEGTHHCTVEI